MTGYPLIRVLALEGRAPGTSKADQLWIHQAFASGQVWPGITDPQQRRELEYRVQSSEGIIPSLKWLQANLLYLNVAAGIIWKLIVPRVEGRKGQRKKMSLQQILRSYWVVSKSTSCVEVQECVFQPVQGQPSFNLAYNQLILAALRQFPYLSKSEPEGKAREKLALSLDLNCVSLFHNRAWLLGFRTSPIKEGIAIATPPFQPKAWTTLSQKSAIFDEVQFFGEIKHRWGRPHIHVFQILQESAFLPTLARAKSHSEVDMIYVLQDLLRTFVQPCNFEYDSSLPCISLNSEAHAHYGLLATTGLPIARSADLALQRIEEPNQLGINNPSRSGVPPFTRPDIAGRAAVHRDVSMADATKYDNVVASSHAPCGRDLMRRSLFEDSTCSRSTLQSLSTIVQEPDAVGRAEYNQPSTGSSSRSRSPLHTLPLPSSSGKSLSKGRQLCRKLGYWQSGSLRPLMPTANNPELPHPKTSSSRSKPLAPHCLHGQDQGQNEDACAPGSCSPTLSRSPVSFLRSQTGSVSSSRYQDSLNLPRVSYPGQLPENLAYLGSRLSPSVDTSSSASRSVVPFSALPQTAQATCLDPQKMEDLHNYLRTLPRGASDRFGNEWQGFDDSDDDIESISM